MDLESARNLMSPSAYDTAWVSKVLKSDELLDWLIKNQKEDGSWGCQINYYHDRILSTYTVVNYFKSLKKYQENIEKGESFIRKNLTNLQKDKLESFGFEFVVGKIIDELNPDLSELKQYYNFQREEKMKRIPREVLLSGQSTIVHYAELLVDLISNQALVNLEKLPNLNCSPSATAWLYSLSGKEEQKKYLRLCLTENKFIPTLYPLENFGTAWILFSHKLVGRENKKEIEFIKSQWGDGGVGLSRLFPFIDLDTTAVAFKVLEKDDYQVFEQFEADEYFVCYEHERVPSVGANIHLLDAIKNINTEKTNSWKEKILTYLKKEMIENSYWLDKWHLSPYYITSHAVVALHNLDDQLKNKSIEWILKTQKLDGSWGFQETGTCEETAYCVLALYHVNQGNKNISEAISRGIKYLKNNFSTYSYPELWVGKVLYCHVGVAKSAIECAILAGKKNN